MGIVVADLKCKIRTTTVTKVVTLSQRVCKCCITNDNGLKGA